KLGQRLRRLGHANLGRQLLVVEDTSQAVVEAHSIKRAGAASSVLSDSVLVELRHGPFVPAKSGGVLIKVLEQPLFGKRNHCWQPDEVGRVVDSQQAWRGVDEVRKLVLANVPTDVRELPLKLLGEPER